MATESTAFVFVVAAIGLVVVFLFLGLLSLFMSAIRGADRLMPSSGQPRSGKATTMSDLETLRKTMARRAETNWVIAAAVAYLDLEERDAVPDAAPWTAGRSGKVDLWYVGKRGG